MAPRKKYLRIIFPALALSLLISFFLYMTFRTHHRTIRPPKGKTKIDLKHAEHRIFRNAVQGRRFGGDGLQGKILLTQGANAQAAMMPELWGDDAATTDQVIPEGPAAPNLIELQDAPALHAVGDEIVPDTGPPRSWLHPTAPDKVVVMGALASQDTRWVHDELHGWSAAVYTVDDNTTNALHTPANKGSESLPYLTYIIDHYTTLPSTIAFIHSHKEGYPSAWHTDNDHYSNVWSLSHLNTVHVQRVGFVNLRCTPEPGCPDGMMLSTGEDLAAQSDVNSTTAEMALPAAIRAMFSPDSNDDEDAIQTEIAIPPLLATPCCAQFAVSRSQVLKVPLRTYERMQRWVLETELPDETSGRVMEYLWHVVFGRDAVFCPEFERCWCDVYGDCAGLRRKEKDEWRERKRKEEEEERQKQKVLERDADESERKMGPRGRENGG